MPTKAELIIFCKKNGIKGYSRLKKKEIQKLIQDDLQRKMNAHWKATKVERKRSHTGKMYEKYIKTK